MGSGRVDFIMYLFDLSVTVFKVFNIKRFYETLPKSFTEKCPVVCELHKSKIQNLHITY